MSQWHYKKDQPMLGLFPFPNLRKGPGIEVVKLLLIMTVLVLLRIAFSTRSLMTLHSESSMEAISVFTIATTAANVGISLLTEQNAVDRCQLTEYSTCELEQHRISIVIATLKDTATKFEGAKYVWDCG